MSSTVKLPKIAADGGFFVEETAFYVECPSDDGIRRIGSVSELLEALNEVLGDSEREVWYRGHRRWSWNLEPTFYRGTEVRDDWSKKTSPYDANSIRMRKYALGNLTDLLKTVKRVLKKAGQRKLLDSDALLLAQHYGVSTPLLDWSTSPLVTAWFALHNNSKLSSEDPPTLWILDPQHANQSVPYELLGEAGNQAGIDFEVLAQVLKRDGKSLAESDIFQDFPMAVYSVGDFATRIGRQSGKFTFSGPRRLYNNVVAGAVTSGNNGERSFAPILLDADRAGDMLNELHLLGINEKTVYGPRVLDDQIARHLKKIGLYSNGRRKRKHSRAKKVVTLKRRRKRADSREKA